MRTASREVVPVHQLKLYRPLAGNRSLFSSHQPSRRTVWENLAGPRSANLTQCILYTLSKSKFTYTDRLISVFIRCLLRGKQRYWFVLADILFANAADELKLNLPKFVRPLFIRLSVTSMELIF